MHRVRGFTIIELIVVMVVMAILLTLGVVSLAQYQVSARNTERSTDIDAIAKGLENRYTNGNSIGNASYISKGAYPSVNEILHAEGQTVATITPTSASQYIDQLLAGTRLANFYPPGTSGAVTSVFVPICTSGCAAAENAAQISAALTSSNVYVYEPITSTGAVCLNTECVRYNLYYLPESGTMQTKVSLHQ